MLASLRQEAAQRLSTPGGQTVESCEALRLADGVVGEMSSGPKHARDIRQQRRLSHALQQRAR